MGKVVVGLSMSLDGFIAGPNDGPRNPLGDGGGRLFDWWSAGTERLGPDDRFKPPAKSRAVVKEMFDCGAIITGRRTFDIANGWGGHHPVGAPFFLLTHNPPDKHVGPGTEEPSSRTVSRAPSSRPAPWPAGGTLPSDAADVAQQYLKAGLLDEIHMNLVPVLLGGGVASSPTSGIASSRTWSLTTPLKKALTNGCLDPYLRCVIPGSAPSTVHDA